MMVQDMILEENLRLLRDKNLEWLETWHGHF